ncbi:MAG TPA: MraY family glycosyltransferase [Bacteroidales bacterium]|nr:MraY family glycosyltransferase [Bacteroidales bacterium]
MRYIVFTNELRIALSFSLALFVTFVLIPSIVDISRAKSYLDTPNSRTSHQDTTPTLGGIAIFIGSIIAFLMFTSIETIPSLQYIVASLLIIFFIGFKDDIIGISPYKKFLGQVMAALIVIEFGRIILTSLHGLFNIYPITYNFGLILSVITIIGVTNCFNLMDGIDGLSASLATLASAAFGSWFFLRGEFDWSVLCAGIMGACIAFLYFNLFSRKNKIFMGDTGSLFLGFIISIIAVKFNESAVDAGGLAKVTAAPAVSIGILMVPIYDTLRVFITRMVKNRPPFSPDKTHIHHYLLALGMTHRQATLVLALTGLLFIVISMMLKDLTVFWLLSVLLSVATVLSFIPIWMVTRRRKTGVS